MAVQTISLSMNISNSSCEAIYVTWYMWIMLEYSILCVTLLKISQHWNSCHCLIAHPVPWEKNRLNALIMLHICTVGICLFGVCCGLLLCMSHTFHDLCVCALGTLVSCTKLGELMDLAFGGRLAWARESPIRWETWFSEGKGIFDRVTPWVCPTIFSRFAATAAVMDITTQWCGWSSPVLRLFVFLNYCY